MSRPKRSPKLEALAAEIERRFPELRASVAPSVWYSSRKAGRIIVHRGPDRHGYELRVCHRANGARVNEWDTADYMTRLEQVRAWIERRAREQCGAAGHLWQDTGAEGVETYLTRSEITKERWAARECTRCLATGHRSTKHTRSRYGLTDTGPDL